PFDPQLAEVPFSFKAACASDFDCRPVDGSAPPEAISEPRIDYLAKDYASFRRLMLDRLFVLVPDWQERNPADPGIALVELLAYAGDSLSYYQDAVMTEGYLGTARSRVSVRRHARLLDYHLHDGCNARAFVALEVGETTGADDQQLPAGRELLTQVDAPVRIRPNDRDAALTQRPQVFQTLHP